MRIFIISSEFPPGPGGIGQHTASLAVALSSKSEVYVLSNQDYASTMEVRQFNTSLPPNINLTVFAARSGKITSVKRIAQAMEMVKKIKPKIVFVSGRFPLWIGAILKLRFPQLRVEGFVHGSEITLTGTTLSKITKRAYTRLDRIIAVSNFTKSLLHKSVAEEKKIVLPNGLDASLLRTAKEVNETLDWRGKPKLLTIGNVTSRKGQHRVVSALPEILKVYPNAHYHVVGLPTESAKLIELAKDLGVEDSLTVHGRIPLRKDLYKAYASSDVFIMLSENQNNGDLEGFGIAILEANAFGIPAIGAKGCGIEDAISQNSGVLVDGDRPDEILGALQELLENKAEYRMGARKWAENHDWSNIINRLL